MWLGHTRLMVVLRLSAFIVLCIGVEITWNGVKALASELTFAPPAALAQPANRHSARAQGGPMTRKTVTDPRHRAGRAARRWRR